MWTRVIRRAMSTSPYSHLSREELVARLMALETPSANRATAASPPTQAVLERGKQPVAGPSTTRQPVLKPGRTPKTTVKPAKGGKKFDHTAHPTRHIALLICYHGWPYSGLAIQSHQSEKLPRDALPTVESQVLLALEKTKLIPEGQGWDGCGYGRCGRTDRGVSSAGQVVHLWVRSGRRDGVQVGAWRPATNPPPPKAAAVEEEDGDDPVNPPKAAQPLAPETELAYPRLLNNVLPPSIRVLAWAPIDEDFDSRFSCKYRHYKYVFHRHPTSSPSTSASSADLLDLDLMHRAAQNLVGEHDFRNFCKLDGSKQIQNHSRRVLEAYFERDESGPASGEGEERVVFNLIGTAFLWHQVRHIIAALFLVGSRLEAPSLIADLLDVERFPGKPNYEMGHPLPLTLWECAYSEQQNPDWRYGSEDGPWRSLDSEKKQELLMGGMGNRATLERELEEQRQEAEVRAWQIGNAQKTLQRVFGSEYPKSDTVIYPVGGGQVRMTAKYRPVAERPIGETPEVVNRKWLEAKGRKEASAQEAEDDE